MREPLEVTATRSGSSRSNVENGSVTMKTLYDTKEDSGEARVGDEDVDDGEGGAEDGRGEDAGEEEVFIPQVHITPRSCAFVSIASLNRSASANAARVRPLGE